LCAVDHFATKIDVYFQNHSSQESGENIMNTSELKEIAKNELVTLRQELNHLKNCQMTVLTASFTSTGVIFGLMRLNPDEPVNPIAYLLPLVVILPSFWIFLDKARTITRIVGYYRILEEIVSHIHIPTYFLGWENSLENFRNSWRDHHQTLKKTKKQSIMKSVINVCKVAIPGSPHGYWTIAYYTFSSLSALCIILAIITLQNPINMPEANSHGMKGLIVLPSWLEWRIIYIASLFVAISLYRNFVLICRLTFGRYTYDNNYQIWKNILK
jgi:hypothetical protein